MQGSKGGGLKCNPKSKIGIFVAFLPPPTCGIFSHSLGLGILICKSRRLDMIAEAPRIHIFQRFVLSVQQRDSQDPDDQVFGKLTQVFSNSLSPQIALPLAYSYMSFMDICKSSLRSMPQSRGATLGGVCRLDWTTWQQSLVQSSQPLLPLAMQKAPHVPTVLPTLGAVHLLIFASLKDIFLYDFHFNLFDYLIF